jgi:hypothetical protein
LWNKKKKENIFQFYLEEERRIRTNMAQSIRRENIKFTAEPFNKIVAQILNKYSVKALNKDFVDLSRNLLNVSIDIELQESRTVSTSGLMSILRNEIAEKIFYFSAIKPNNIQIILGAED